MKKVVKFGGSSLASAEQFKKVGDIIRSDESRRYVVPSAPGKRFDGDIKVTDMLYECYRAAEKGEKIAGKIKKIQARYQEIIDGLELDLKLDEQFAEIEKNFIAQAGSDYAASRGEFLNGIVMANYQKDIEFKINYISPLGSFATWKSTKQTGSYDLRTFEIHALPVEKVEGLRPGMSVLYQLP